MRGTFAFLFLIIAVAGCAGLPFGTSGVEGIFSQSQGLSFQKFTFDVASVESGGMLELYAKFQNVGGKTASSVALHIYGAPFAASCSGRGLAFCVADSGQDSGVSTSGVPLSWTSSDLTTLGEMAPPDVGAKMPGDSAFNTWRLQPPLLSSGLSSPYELIGRLCYTYSTEAVATVDVISFDEKKLEEQAKTYSSKAIEMINSAGPIQLSIKTLQPIVVYTTTQAIPLVVSIKNTGGGVVYSGDCTSPTSASTNKITLAVTASAGTISSACSSASVDISVKTGEGTLRCDWTPPSSVATKQRVSFNAMISSYNYYIEKTASVKVVG